MIIALLLSAATLVLTRSPARPERPVPAAATEVGGDRISFPVGRYPILTMPNGSQRVIHSLLRVDRRMRFGDYVWNDRGVPAGPVWVRVDLATQTLSVFRGGHEIGTAVILYGTDDKPTPTGSFPVLQRAAFHHSTLYDADMPFMLRLTADGVAIHASSVRQGSATHGCIGVPFGFAEQLFAQVRRGDTVVILPPAVVSHG